MPLEPLDRIGKAVTAGVEIGIVDLLGVTGQNHFGAFTGAADDGLDLMRRQVLGLVDDHVLARDGAAPDIGQGLEFNLILPDHAIDAQFGGCILFAAVGQPHEVGEIVEDRLHPQLHLVVLGAGKIADVAAERDNGSGYQQFLVAAAFDGVRQPCSQG